MKNKRSPGRIVFNILNYTFLGLFALLCLYPLWYVFIYSISDPQLVERYGLTILPRGFTLRNFGSVLEIQGIFPAMGISVLRTVVGTVFSLFSCMFLGYLFTKEEMPGKKFWYRFVMITMYVSGGMIPFYLAVRAYGLLNTFWIYVFPTVSAYNVLLIKTFVEQLPREMEESATIDGAGTMKIFLRIILPLSLPIAATISIFVSVGQWNAWFDNHIFNTNRPDLTTLQYLLYNYLKQAEHLAALLKEKNAGNINQANYLTPSGVRMTVTMITVIPILLVYPFFQKYIVKGIMIGAVKG